MTDPARPAPVMFTSPPAAVCLLRLSSIGDVCHTLAVLRALQSAWPKTRFTWIIGAAEAKLMRPLVPEVEFIIFDKRHWLRAAASLVRILARRRFDLLLHLQLSLRASVVSLAVRAPLRLGFDRARARELQWMFTNVKIPARAREHVLDALLGFVRACGIEPGAPRWNVMHSQGSQQAARVLTVDSASTLVISPASSRAVRNWSAENYAAVAAHAIEELGMRVVLVGGPSALEAELGKRIAEQIPEHLASSLRNLIGEDTLPDLLALLARATLLLTPDSGPAHMATMVGTPVVGLYAATNPERSGPYLSIVHCVNQYDAACRKFLGKPASELPWTQKVEHPGVMDLITVKQVIAQLECLMAKER